MYLEKLECALLTQTERGYTDIKKFDDEIELAIWLVQIYKDELEKRGAL